MTSSRQSSRAFEIMLTSTTARRGPNYAGIGSLFAAAFVAVVASDHGRDRCAGPATYGPISALMGLALSASQGLAVHRSASARRRQIGMVRPSSSHSADRKHHSFDLVLHTRHRRTKPIRARSAATGGLRAPVAPERGGGLDRGRTGEGCGTEGSPAVIFLWRTYRARALFPRAVARSGVVVHRSSALAAANNQTGKGGGPWLLFMAIPLVVLLHSLLVTKRLRDAGARDLYYRYFCRRSLHLDPGGCCDRVDRGRRNPGNHRGALMAARGVCDDRPHPRRRACFRVGPKRRMRRRIEEAKPA